MNTLRIFCISLLMLNAQITLTGEGKNEFGKRATQLIYPKHTKKQTSISTQDISDSLSSSINELNIAALTISKVQKSQKIINAKRSRNIYNPTSRFCRISRSRIENFLKCPRCFYIDRVLGIDHPASFPFTLNNAIDSLLKKEFDLYRERQEVHPYCIAHNINAVPFQHPDLNKWRNSLYQGVEYNVPETNIQFHGGLDDIWQDQDTKELIVVDYKATSKNSDVSLDAEWQGGYKRQVEMYQYLLRKNGFKVSNTAYFVYCNGIADAESFDNKLDFKVSLLAYEGNDTWVEPVIIGAYQCLQSKTAPEEITPTCGMCQYTKAIQELNTP